MGESQGNLELVVTELPQGYPALGHRGGGQRFRRTFSHRRYGYTLEFDRNFHLASPSNADAKQLHREFAQLQEQRVIE